MIVNKGIIFSANGNDAAEYNINPHILSHTTLDPQSNEYLGNYSSITSKVNRARKDRKSKEEIKIDNMHMKRNLPQLYLSREAREGRSGSMNDFNIVLKYCVGLAIFQM